MVYATGDTQAGSLASGLYPSVAAEYPNLVFDEFDPAKAEGLDVVFLGLPHEASMAVAPQLHGKVGCVVDLSAAFRLKDASLYPTWYGFVHDQPELLAGRGRPPRVASRGPQGSNADRHPRLPRHGGNARAGSVGRRRSDPDNRRDRQLHHRGQRCWKVVEAHIDVLHCRRRRQRLRPARPPSHSGDRAGDRRSGALHAAPRAASWGCLLRATRSPTGDATTASPSATLAGRYRDGSRSSSSVRHPRRRRPCSEATSRSSRRASTNAPTP